MIYRHPPYAMRIEAAIKSASASPELKHPKGATRKTLKGRRDYRESQQKRVVRAKCVMRDGDCWLMGVEIFGECWGESEWNHFRRRSATRGMSPEERHNTKTSGMCCTKHHRQIDENEIDFQYLTEAGADGPMAFWNEQGRHDERFAARPPRF